MQGNQHDLSKTLKQKIPALLDHPSKLFIEPTTRCNLQCQMCVRQSSDQLIAEGDLDKNRFKSLQPAFQNLTALIFSGIGEPLLHPKLEQFINMAKKEMPNESWIGIQSNGCLLTEERADSLLKAGLNKICISMDAASEEALNNIRTGLTPDFLDRAFSALQKSKNKTNQAQLKIGVEFVLMRDNMNELPEVLRWVASKGANFAIVTQLLPYEPALTSQIIYQFSTDASIELFNKWQQKANAQGLDLRNYFQALQHFYKTIPEDLQKTIDLVEEMKAEAESKDIPIYLKNLFKKDNSWLEKAESLFKEAKDIADDLNIDLKLPAILSEYHRQCSFVEDGGAFISWDGNVHPCYSLWHHYSCYIDGRKKYFKPKILGNLSKQSIIEIWNTNSFHSFRKNATAYEYPFCSNCSFVPCEHITRKDFEEDCYTIDVPCGDCLWCMGLLHCLQ